IGEAWAATKVERSGGDLDRSSTDFAGWRQVFPFGEVSACHIGSRTSERDLGPTLGAADRADRLTAIEAAENCGAGARSGPDVEANGRCHLRRRRAGRLRPHQTQDHPEHKQSSGGSHLDHGSAHSRLQPERRLELLESHKQPKTQTAQNSNLVTLVTARP